MRHPASTTTKVKSTTDQSHASWPNLLSSCCCVYNTICATVQWIRPVSQGPTPYEMDRKTQTGLYCNPRLSRLPMIRGKEHLSSSCFRRCSLVPFSLRLLFGPLRLMNCTFPLIFNRVVVFAFSFPACFVFCFFLSLYNTSLYT